METIKSYLDAMFATMPNTEAVKKAKGELYQMMEDKYNELVENGVSENEAVGTVISEFGNLDELADDLGLNEEVAQQKEYSQNIKRRFVSIDEVQDFLAFRVNQARRQCLAIFLCIVCACPIIFTEALGADDKYGFAGMFVFLVAAVFLFIYNGQCGSRFSYLFSEPCQIDMMTNDYVLDAKRKFEPTRSLMKTIGIVLCAICWVPSSISNNVIHFEKFGALWLFICVGIGVFLIVYSNKINGSYNIILGLNDANTISGNYTGNMRYTNSTVATIMSVYQPTVTCIYFIWSFLTFDWALTWIIFPIAVIIRKIINMNFMEEAE